MQVTVENYELRTGDLTRKNKYTFKLSDIDTENIIIKSYGSGFGIFLYTKDFKKVIKQAVILIDSGKTDILQQELICISDFPDKTIVDEIKSNFIKAINSTKKK